MTLDSYILRRFLRSLLQVMGAIGGLAALLMLLENIRFAASKGATLREAGVLTAYQLPDVFAQTLPLILMLAALVTFLGLSRSSEMVVVRASGISGLRVLLLPVVASAALGVIAITLLNPIVAASSARAVDYRAAIGEGSINILSVDDQGLWLRQGLESGQTVIQARLASQDGTVITGVRLHQFDTRNRLVARIEAERGTLAPDSWVLENVRRWWLDLPQGMPLRAPEELAELQLPTNLTREEILESFARPEMVAIWELPRFIRQLERAGFSAVRHRVFFQSELARPALFIAMVLIGAGFSLRHVRFGQTGVMVLFAILAGFSLYFFKDIAETLGGNGDIPILLAAWSPPAAAILIALGLLLHLEDG